jgi:hypothetical protein
MLRPRWTEMRLRLRLPCSNTLVLPGLLLLSVRVAVRRLQVLRCVQDGRRCGCGCGCHVQIRDRGPRGPWVAGLLVRES